MKQNKKRFLNTKQSYIIYDTFNDNYCIKLHKKFLPILDNSIVLTGFIDLVYATLVKDNLLSDIKLGILNYENIKNIIEFHTTCILENYMKIGYKYINREIENDIYIYKKLPTIIGENDGYTSTRCIQTIRLELAPDLCSDDGIALISDVISKSIKLIDNPIEIKYYNLLTTLL